MDSIEKLIKSKRDLFDDAEPASGHFERFAFKMEREPVKKGFHINRPLILKMAAVCLLFITATLLIMDFRSQHQGFLKGNVSNNSTFSAELDDAMRYYDGRTSLRMGEFKKLACCGEEQSRLRNMIELEMNALDASTIELRRSLQENPDNERVQAALIKNQQMKEQILDNVIERMKSR